MSGYFDSDAMRAEAMGSHGQLGRAWKALLNGEFDVPGLPLNKHSNVYGNALFLKSGVGILFGFTATTTNAAAQWIQIHDKREPPALGDIPAAPLLINRTAAAAGDTLAVSYIFPGRFFLAGCWIVNSTTGPTYTAGAADTFFDAQFL